MGEAAAVALERAQRAEAELEQLKQTQHAQAIQAIPAPSQASSEKVGDLQKTIRQLEKMLDNASRLQTRAEIGLQKSMTEAKGEMEGRQKAESMLKQLMARLNQLPEAAAGITQIRRQSTRASSVKHA